VVDRVQPLKIEGTDSGGEETDLFPTAMDRNEDYVDARGVTLQNLTSNDDAVRVERSAAGGDLQFLDVANPTPTTLSQLKATSGITEEEHRNLDQLVHNLAENYFEEYTYDGNRVTGVITWASVAKLQKIREEQYTYDGSKVSEVVTIQYNAAGTEFERVTETYLYSGPKIVSTTSVRSTP
jgi:hypothetical protein